MFGMITAKSREGKYYCPDCETWHDEIIVNEWDEPRGEFWGSPCTEHIIEWLCPDCGGEGVVEASEVFIVDDEEEEEE